MNRKKEMGKIDGIIFDVDGTLWESVNSIWLAWKEELANLGYQYEFSVEQFKSLFGQPVDRFGDVLFSDLSVEDRRALAHHCAECQLNKMRENRLLYPYDGVVEALPVFAKDYPLFIVTNADNGYAQLFMEFTHTEDCFTDFEHLGIPGRTKADNIRIIMERNHLRNAVYVGDTALDQQSSQEAGARFIWASYGFDSTVENDLIIHNFHELHNCLKKIENDS